MPAASPRENVVAGDQSSERHGQLNMSFASLVCCEEYKSGRIILRVTIEMHPSNSSLVRRTVRNADPRERRDTRIELSNAASLLSYTAIERVAKKVRVFFNA